MVRRLHRLALLVAVLPAPTFAADTLLPEISVSAGFDPLETRRHAATATFVFDRADIEALDASSVGELLGRLPGTGLSADTESRRGRGKGPDKMMPTILVDGEPLPGGGRNPATALRLSPDLIERIEVIRNPGAEYPAAGPGGIVNLVLRDVPPRPTGSLRGGLGTQDGASLLRFDGQYGTRDGTFGWLLAGSANRRPLTGESSTGVQRFTAGARTAWTEEEARARGHEDTVTLAPRLEWRLAGGTQFVLSPLLAGSAEQRDTLTRKFAYADAAAGTGRAASGHEAGRNDGRRESLRLVGEWRGSGPTAAPWNEFSVRTLLQTEREDKRKAKREYDAAGMQTASRDEDERRTETEFGLSAKAKRLAAEAHLLGFGAEFKMKNGDENRAATANGAPVVLGADAAARQRDRHLVLWAQDEWQATDRLLLTAGLRWQARHSRVTDGAGIAFARATRSADPSLHALWQALPGWNLRASVVRQQRAPGMKDLSSVVRTADGVNSSGNPDKTGNPQLRDQITLAFEAGVEHFFADRAGSAGLSLFRRRIDNQVQKLTLPDGARWVERPYNVGTALLTGGVLDLKARLDALGLSQLTVRGNYAATHTRLLAASVAGAGEGPRTHWNLGLDYEFAEHRLSVGGNFSAVSALDRESSASVRQTQGARRQLDLYARKRLDRNFSLRLSAGNLTHPDRRDELRETDAGGQLARLETDRARSAPTLFLTLEGKL